MAVDLFPCDRRVFFAPRFARTLLAYRSRLSFINTACPPLAAQVSLLLQFSSNGPPASACYYYDYHISLIRFSL